MPQDTTPHEQGKRGGLRLDTTAADCPYPPGGDQEARDAWLAGFGASRKDRPPVASPGGPDQADRGEPPAYKQG